MSCFLPRICWISVAAAWLLAILPSPSVAADLVSDLLAQARRAQQEGNLDEALAFATKAIEAEPKNYQPYFYRAGVYEVLGRHAQAVADYDRILELAPRLSQIYDLRGSEKFKLGQIRESIVDFDKYLSAFPELWPQHWKRGIAYYYAGRFDEGRKQFEGYQSFDNNDVENAVWRYLCMAPTVGVEKARDEILKIKDDRRVPMMQVYALYAGKAKPEDVMAAVKEGNPSEAELNSRLFYAHLYLGLYYEVAGDKQKAKEEINQAEKHKIGHYMWDVARVHAKKLADDGKSEK